MKVLFTALPVPSHLRILMPIAQALVARGHSVTAAVSEQVHHHLTPHGIDVVAAGVDVGGIVGPFTSDSIAGSTRVVNIPLKAFLPGIAQSNAEDFLPIAESLKPDLILREETELGGYLVAQRLGIPHACVAASGGTFDPASLLRRLNLMGLTSETDGAALHGQRYIDYFPPAFRFFSAHLGPNSRSYRLPLPAHRGESMPSWYADIEPGRPVVLATMGTLAQRTAVEFVPRVVEALSGMDCEATVVGAGESVHGNVRLVNYVPQPLLLPTCDLFITHGGISSIREALMAGVPMVVTPFGADQPYNARRVGELGVGMHVNPAKATVDEIREACETVLSDPAYARTARTAARHFLTLPDVEAAVDDLESVAGQR